MKPRFLVAGFLVAGVLVYASSISTAFASVLAAITHLGPDGQTGSSSASLEVASGGTPFSQGGLKFSHGGYGMDTTGLFDNLQGVPLSENFPSLDNYLALFDFGGMANRIESAVGVEAPLLLQPDNDGAVGVGMAKATPQLLSVGGGNVAVFDPASLASESLTNPNLTGGTSWTATNDCALTANAATCTFSAGTASTIQQASGTLAIAGITSRMYKWVYTISGVSGTPTAALTTAFFNVAPDAPLALDIRAGTHIQYFQANLSPGNFVISTTLTAGQSFTIDTLSLKEILGGVIYLGANADAAGYSVKGVAGFTGSSATSCTPTAIKGGIITSATCI